MNRKRIADSKLQSLGKQEKTTLFWQQISESNPSVMDIYQREDIDRVVMLFGSIVDGQKDNKAKGVLVGRILVDELFKIMGDISLSNDTLRKLEVSLIDKDGLMLYSNNANPAGFATKYKQFDLIKNSKW